jgi:hypothetical protein
MPIAGEATFRYFEDFTEIVGVMIWTPEYRIISVRRGEKKRMNRVWNGQRGWGKARSTWEIGRKVEFWLVEDGSVGGAVELLGAALERYIRLRSSIPGGDEATENPFPSKQVNE